MSSQRLQIILFLGGGGVGGAIHRTAQSEVQEQNADKAEWTVQL